MKKRSVLFFSVFLTAMVIFASCELFQSDEEIINLKAKVVLPTRIDLSWSIHSSSGESYYMQRKSPSSNGFVQVWSGSSIRSWSDTAVSPGTTYSYKLKVSSYSTKSGSYSNYTSGTVTVATEPLITGKILSGEWVRMDNGNPYYITSANRIFRGSTADSRYEITTATVTSESPQVLKVVQDGALFYLFASRVAKAGFSGSIANVGVDLPQGSFAGSRAAGDGLGNIPPRVNFSNSNDPASTKEVATKADGTFEVDDIIPGDEYIVTIAGKRVAADGKELLITPRTNGDNIGTITVVDNGVNFKTSIEPYSSNAQDMMQLYADGTTRYTFRIYITNTGDEDCMAPMLKLTYPTDLTRYYDDGTASKLKVETSRFTTIEKGKRVYAERQILCNAILRETELEKIDIEITDSATKRKWSDSVSLRFNQKKTRINFMAYKGTIQGVVITPTAKTYQFSTSGLDYIDVPWSTEDYLIIFSGATAATEAVYSVGINTGVASNAEYLDYYFGEENDLWNYEDTNHDGINGDNDIETGAVLVKNQDRILSYLHKNDVDFYRISLRETAQNSQ